MSKDTLLPPPTQEPFARDLSQVSLEERVKSSYLDYAMSVIVGRALPDVRDGLKPVHRRTLFAMHEANNDWNKPFKKSARIVGDVLGKYHPHSQDAVYDALVRMAQPFSMRAVLVDGQGNFGSIDGDNPAAMRYTEVRMAKIAHSLLDDLDKETVDFQPNYDGAEKEPTVLPARFPNLLVNGAAGIAVGMATNIPPHNLGETIDACLHLLAKPSADVDELMRFVPAPDFPTGAFICGVAGAREAYRTGRGRVTMRARARFEELDKGRQAIVVDELPYQVNKATLIARIADLARDKKINGISDLRDESDRRGIRVVVELRRGENAEVVLNNLYKETQLQENFSVNMVAICDGAPRQLSLKQMLELFLEHRREVVVRRSIFELARARGRAHLLEGFAAAVANVDEIVELIKASESPQAAEDSLCGKAWRAKAVANMLARLEDPLLARPQDIKDGGLDSTAKGGPVYRFSRAQAKAILDMRLARLTAMERDKINADYADVVAKIVELLDLLADPKKIRAVVAAELREAKKQFADERRSEIVEAAGDIDVEQLIKREPMAVTFSHSGYVKRQPIADYRTQRRGGRGKQATASREDDFTQNLFVASTHDYLLVFTNRGRIHWKKVHELPPASRIGRGKHIVNLLELNDNEKTQTVLPVDGFDGDRYVVMATAGGVVKKTKLADFSRPRRAGIIAIDLADDDTLVNAVITGGSHSIALLSNAGKALRFDEKKIRAMGRGARGVRGMKLPAGVRIVSMLAFSPEEEKSAAALVATANGYGKRTAVADFAAKGRAGQGVIAMKTTDKTGPVVGACFAGDDDELMLITNGGVLVRTAMRDIRRMGRATQGVRLIRTDDGDTLASVARIADGDNDDENGDIDVNNAGDNAAPADNNDGDSSA